MRRLTLPKASRILKRRQYLYVSRCGVCRRGDQALLYVVSSRCSTRKLGITVSKKFGKAHERNFFKRVVREAFRQVRHDLPPCQIVVMPKGKQCFPDFHGLINDFTEHIPTALAKLTKRVNPGDGCNLKSEKYQSGPQ